MWGSFVRNLLAVLALFDLVYQRFFFFFLFFYSLLHCIYSIDLWFYFYFMQPSTTIIIIWNYSLNGRFKQMSQKQFDKIYQLFGAIQSQSITRNVLNFVRPIFITCALLSAIVGFRNALSLNLSCQFCIDPIPSKMYLISWMEYKIDPRRCIICISWIRLHNMTNAL